MKLAATAVVCALAAIVAAGAEDAKAPLADTKQQLQQLQRDQTAAKGGADDSSLKGALPELRTTAPGRDPLSSTELDPNKKAKEHGRKRAAKDNWLVDGYDRLGAKTANGKSGDKLTAGGSDTDEKEDEAGEHDDLIQLYEKQERSGDTIARQDKVADAKLHHAPAADPLAPFLQGWLANSPVRDAAMATIPKNDGGGGFDSTPMPVGGPSPTVPVAGTGNLLSGPVAGPPADNPYLLALTMPVLTGSPANPAPLAPIGSPDGFSGNSPAAKPNVNGPVDTAAPPARSDTYKPPLTPADEDKKYFPQLKRF
jgi:hypothetical protein